MTAERDPVVLRRTAAWHDGCAARARSGFLITRHERIARELREEADRLEAQDRKDNA